MTELKCILNEVIKLQKDKVLPHILAYNAYVYLWEHM